MMNTQTLINFYEKRVKEHIIHQPTIYDTLNDLSLPFGSFQYVFKLFPVKKLERFCIKIYCIFNLVNLFLAL